MNRPGDDLRVPPGPGVPHGLVVPAADLVERFSRSSGPGGQSVNTSDSRVELVLDVATTSAFSDEQRARVLRVLGPDRLVGTSLVVTASEHRAQLRNRTAARRRLVALLAESLAPPAPPRRRTRPTRGSQRRRLEGKRQRGQTKSLRGRVRDE